MSNARRMRPTLDAHHGDIFGRAFWMGTAALIGIVVTAGLTYEANRREETAVLHLRERARLARTANLMTVSRRDAVRGYLIAPDSETIRTVNVLRTDIAATLDTLAAESAAIPGEATIVDSLRVEIATWDTTFVHAALTAHPNAAIPRLLLGAAAHLSRRVDEGFASLNAAQDRDFAVALRKGDALRAASIVSIAVEVFVIIAGFAWLCKRVRLKAARLAQSQTEILERLGLAAEVRDDDTAGHTQRVGRLSGRLAQALGLDDETVELIRRAAPLHDIGKIGIPDRLLFKQAPLDDDERTLMRSRTAIGAGILSRGESNIVQMAERIAHSHHEKWDGTGYPDALRGEEIPLEARIVAVADFFDAMTSDRPYRKAWKPAAVLDEIRRLRGSDFDPRVADAFLDRDCHEGHGTGTGSPRASRQDDTPRPARKTA